MKKDPELGSDGELARQIDVVKSVLANNDTVAESNRQRFQAAGVLAINLMASPGAGKTSFILATIKELAGRARVGVIEGDVAGSIDTETVLDGGAHDAVQINTGGGCHLEAGMIERALDDLDLDALDIVFIENVGNLICPTSWDLGEAYKVCLASTPEGSDKPIKYPELFAASDVVVLNKVDLMEHLDFDRAQYDEALNALNSDVTVFDVSSRTGEGVEAWVNWLLERGRDVPRPGY